MFEGHNRTPFRKIGEGVHLAVYNSVDDMWYDAAMKQTPQNVTTSNRSSRHTRRNKWSGTNSFEEAYEMGSKTGWLEGADKSRKAQEGILGLSAVLVGTRVEKLSTVAGGSVNIGRFVGGDKRHMTRRKRRRTGDGTHVSIALEGVASCGTESKAIMARGVGMTGLVMAIESLGISTELSVIYTTRGGSTTSVTSVTIKKPGTYLNNERVAMALGHTASLRRGWFGICERQERFMEDFYGGYGRVINTPKNAKELLGVDYMMPNINKDENKWESMSDKQIGEWIKKTFDKIVTEKNIKIT